jgi:lipooligosaccharide transport system permease protein
MRGVALDPADGQVARIGAVSRVVPSRVGSSCVLFSLLAGFMFACVAIIFAATATRIDTLNVPAYLIMTPMFLFSGVFFPLDVMPPWARTVAAFLPLTHVVGFMRGASLDATDGSLARGLLGTIVFTIPALWLGLRLMYRRVIK